MMSGTSDLPAPSAESPTLRLAPPPPAPLELELLRQSVKSKLFGSQEAPVRIGRFRVLGCIGQGGMGIVYSAHDEQLNRTVAIKLMRPELSAASGQGRRRLTSEAQSLAQLSHPNVVSVFDVGDHDGQLFIAMEYVEGQTLRHWLQGGRSRREILEVFLAAGRGLDAAHRSQLIHRDFKPDNVLVGNDGRPRILDFGLARPPGGAAEAPPSLPEGGDPLATSLSRDGTLLGTPAYMAPEQHLGDPADARSDQFSFCVALYQALFGEFPFAGEDLRTISLAIVSGKVRTRSHPSLPVELADAILRGLSVDSTHRHENMEALLRLLEGQLERVDDKVEAPIDHRFDTVEVEQVLERAAELESGRPGLSVQEIQAVAAEAGLDPNMAKAAADELRASAASASASLVASPSTSLAQRQPPPERESMGMLTSISSQRQLARPLDLGLAHHIIRELERAFETRGKHEIIGSSLAWSTDEIEVMIDPSGQGGARGSVLQIRRKFDAVAKRRRRRWMVPAGLISLPIGAILTEASGADHPGPLFFVAACFVFGALRAARSFHNKRIQEEREHLEYVSDRIDALVAAGLSSAPLREQHASPA